MLKRERHPELDAYDEGCLVLRRDGAVAGHVATALTSFWSPGRPLTLQRRVWLVVVWADGQKEDVQEDYPPWTFVHEIRGGRFEWPHDGPHGGTYEAAWLSEEERAAMWTELGVTPDDF